jgi:inner membrane transporter RhtA
LGCVSAQSGSALATTLFRALGPLGLSSFRCLVAATVLLAITRPQLRGRTGQALAISIAFGATLAASTICSYEAISRIPIATSVTISMLGPLAVSLTGRRRAVDILLVLLALLGVLCIVGGLARGSGFGLVFAVSQTILLAISLFLLRHTARESKGAEGIAISLVVAAVLTMPLTVVAIPKITGLPMVLSIVGVGVFGGVAPQLLELHAMRKTSVGLVALLICMDPVVAALIGWLALAQRLSGLELVGIAAVVLATAAGGLRENRATRAAGAETS